jgi:hypothetical protein
LKEEAMNQVVSTLANGTVHVWEAAAVVAAAIALRGTSNQITKTRQSKLDTWTLKDIGVEPGTLTWMR